MSDDGALDGHDALLFLRAREEREPPPRDGARSSYLGTIKRRSRVGKKRTERRKTTCMRQAGRRTRRTDGRAAQERNLCKAVQVEGRSVPFLPALIIQHQEFTLERAAVTRPGRGKLHAGGGGGEGGEGGLCNSALARRPTYRHVRACRRLPWSVSPSVHVLHQRRAPHVLRLFALIRGPFTLCAKVFPGRSNWAAGCADAFAVFMQL